MKTELYLIVNTPDGLPVTKHDLIRAAEKGIQNLTKSLHEDSLPAEHHPASIKYRNLPDEVRIQVRRAANNVKRGTFVEIDFDDKAGA